MALAPTHRLCSRLLDRSPCMCFMYQMRMSNPPYLFVKTVDTGIGTTRERRDASSCSLSPVVARLHVNVVVASHPVQNKCDVR